MRKGTALLLLAFALALPARAEDVPLESLLGNLLRANRPEAIDAALDRLSERIGRTPGFADAGAFADWLANIAEKKAKDPRVQLRRGWGYITVGRGRDAIAPLEEARKSSGLEPIASGYLGVAWRQSGEPEKALAALARAADGGFVEVFLDENADSAARALRIAKPSKDAEGLPAFAEPFLRFVEARGGHPTLRATLARWLIEDHESQARPGRDRDRAWARFAAEQTAKTLAADPTMAGGAMLAYDAATALEDEDRATSGRTLRFDLLATACRVGDRPEIESHDAPQAFTALAEAALEEQRYALAYRMARRRLDLSDSPGARRVLDALPPDVGD